MGMHTPGQTITESQVECIHDNTTQLAPGCTHGARRLTWGCHTNNGREMCHFLLY